MISLTNENWYYLYLEDGSGGIIKVPPGTTMDFPDYISRYADKFIRDTVPGTVPTDEIPIGSYVSVYSISNLDGSIGVVVNKDKLNYQIDFGTKLVWFPYQEVEFLSVLPLNTRFTENEEIRITESGDVRIMEGV